MLDAGPKSATRETLRVYVARKMVQGRLLVQHLSACCRRSSGLRYEWVFVLLDDINATRLSLSHLLKVTIHNKLSWASPAQSTAALMTMWPNLVTHPSSSFRRLQQPSTRVVPPPELHVVDDATNVPLFTHADRPCIEWCWLGL